MTQQRQRNGTKLIESVLAVLLRQHARRVVKSRILDSTKFETGRASNSIFIPRISRDFPRDFSIPSRFVRVSVPDKGFTTSMHRNVRGTFVRRASIVTDDVGMLFVRSYASIIERF